MEAIRCPSCGAINRAPLKAVKSGKTRCGKCKTPLELPRAPIETTDELFAVDVIQSEMPVLVDFWAAWCGPCKMMAPILSQFAAKNAGKLKVVKVNSELAVRSSAAYQVQSIPTMFLFNKGQVIKQLIGAMPLARLEQELAGLF